MFRPLLLATAALRAAAGGEVQPPPAVPAQTGAEMYASFCAVCHGASGRGDGPSAGFLEVRPRDFTDCKSGAAEADDNLALAIRQGGLLAGVSAQMPAYEFLDDEQTAALIAQVRGFCIEPGWVREELSFPRWLLGSKAYVENEVVITPGLALGGAPEVEVEVDLRPWPRTAIEVEAKIEASPSGSIGLKHVLFDDLERRRVIATAMAVGYGGGRVDLGPRLLAGTQLGPVTFQGAVGGSFLVHPVGEPTAFAAIAVHAPARKPFGRTLAAGLAVRGDFAAGSPPAWRVAPQLYYRHDEVWSAAVGAAIPIGSGAFTASAVVAYEYAYPF